MPSGHGHKQEGTPPPDALNDAPLTQHHLCNSGTGLPALLFKHCMNTRHRHTASTFPNKSSNISIPGMCDMFTPTIMLSPLWPHPEVLWPEISAQNLQAASPLHWSAAFYSWYANAGASYRHSSSCSTDVRRGRPLNKSKNSVSPAPVLVLARAPALIWALRRRDAHMHDAITRPTPLVGRLCGTWYVPGGKGCEGLSVRIDLGNAAALQSLRPDCWTCKGNEPWSHSRNFFCPKAGITNEVCSGTLYRLCGIRTSMLLCVYLVHAPSVRDTYYLLAWTVVPARNGVAYHRCCNIKSSKALPLIVAACYSTAELYHTLVCVCCGLVA